MAPRGRPRIHEDDRARWRTNKQHYRHPPTTYVPASQAPAPYVTSLEDLLASGQRFGCILADPPWRYANTATRGSVGPVFPTMTLSELAALPIAALAAPDAHLHLWVTDAFLLKVEPLIEAWGFHYSGAKLTWVKTTQTLEQGMPQAKIGLGNYWRHADEVCLLGTRGTLVAQHHQLPLWCMAPPPRDALCTKPDRARDLIEQLSPPPYLEVFGRRAMPGWTVWGNQCLPANGRLFKEQVG
jgi:N6-adenosine-specific RNA methylase IME4